MNICNCCPSSPSRQTQAISHNNPSLASRDDQAPRSLHMNREGDANSRAGETSEISTNPTGLALANKINHSLSVDQMENAASLAVDVGRSPLHIGEEIRDSEIERGIAGVGDHFFSDSTVRFQVNRDVLKFELATVASSNTPIVSEVVRDLHDLNPKTVENVIRHLSDRNINLCFGETHSDPAPKRFLIDHMPHFHEMGYRTLYMEHLHMDTHGILERGGNNVEAAIHHLQSDVVAGHLSDEEKSLFADVLRSALKVGMRVVPLDTSGSHSVIEPLDRDAIFSSTANSIVRNNDDGEKYMTYTGEAHTRLGNSDGTKWEKTAGTTDLLPNTVDINIQGKASPSSETRVDIDATKYLDNPKGGAQIPIKSAVLISY